MTRYDVQQSGFEAVLMDRKQHELRQRRRMTMARPGLVRVAPNGYGVIGKRVGCDSGTVGSDYGRKGFDREDECVSGHPATFLLI